jgi:hypothetical protein
MNQSSLKVDGRVSSTLAGKRLQQCKMIDSKIQVGSRRFIYVLGSYCDTFLRPF